MGMASLLVTCALNALLRNSTLFPRACLHALIAAFTRPHLSQAALVQLHQPLKEVQSP
jgi:hypothetical protein